MSPIISRIIKNRYWKESEKLSVTDQIFWLLAELWALSLKIPIMEVNAAQQNDKINAQSGLIDSNGERSLRVPDSGEQFFTAGIHDLTR
jgi:hypothetical protein